MTNNKELEKWLSDKAIGYTRQSTINKLLFLKTRIQNEPDVYERYKTKMAEELFFLYMATRLDNEYVGREFLAVLNGAHMTIDEAKYILDHYDWEEDRMLTAKELKLKAVKAIIKYKCYNPERAWGRTKKMLARLEEKGESELLKSFSLDIFEDRYAGIKYYKQMILKDINFLLVRMTEEEMKEDIDDLIKEIHRMRKTILENYSLVPEMTRKVKKELDELLDNEELKKLKEEADNELEQEQEATE